MLGGLIRFWPILN